MPKHELLEMENWQHDSIINAKRVMLVGSTQQAIIDEAITGTTYVGNAAPGIATSDSNWLVTKIVESGTTTTITRCLS